MSSIPRRHQPAMEIGIASHWELEGRVGRHYAGALSCEVDVAHPERGLVQVTVHGIALDGTILAVSPDADADLPQECKHKAWPASLTDAYVRGHDLVASYSAAKDWPFAPQIYWRGDPVDPASSLAGSMSVLISVQTHLLDTHPEISVISCLQAEEFLEVTAPAGNGAQPIAVRIEEAQRLLSMANPRCLLWRLKDSNISYVETMPSSDFRDVTVERREDGTGQARWRIFADFLEKGVIRRARIQASFLLRENDVELAAACCRALGRSPLPLTA